MKLQPEPRTRFYCQEVLLKTVKLISHAWALSMWIQEEASMEKTSSTTCHQFIFRANSSYTEAPLVSKSRVTIEGGRGNLMPLDLGPHSARRHTLFRVTARWHGCLIFRVEKRTTIGWYWLLLIMRVQGKWISKYYLLAHNKTRGRAGAAPPDQTSLWVLK